MPGVQAAARVALTPGSAIIGSNYVNIRMMGIDRVDFSQVAFWRQDFAQMPLGALMNTLALTTEGVLVPRGFMEQYNMKPGDAFRISLNQFREAEPFEVKVVGVFELWPTWYPTDGPMIIGNLDHLFERAGTEFPYNVWLKVETGCGLRYPDCRRARPFPACVRLVNLDQPGDRRTRIAPTAGIVWPALGGLYRPGNADRAGLFALRVILIPPSLCRAGDAAGSRSVIHADDPLFGF